MRRVLLFVLLILLSACRTEIIVVTSTPLPATAAPTETATPTLPTSTPTIEGCQPSLHCNYIGEPINANYDWTGAPNTYPPGQTQIIAGIETIQRTVQHPRHFDYECEATGLHGDKTIPNWIRNVFYTAAGEYEENITSSSGVCWWRTFVELNANQKYVAVYEYRPDVYTIDPALSYQVSKTGWREVCEIMTDAGIRYTFEPQSVSDSRTSWSQRITEEIVISFKAMRDMGVVISCGVDLAYPAFGNVNNWLRARVVPINWADRDIQKVIR